MVILIISLFACFLTPVLNLGYASKKTPDSLNMSLISSLLSLKITLASPFISSVLCKISKCAHSESRPWLVCGSRREEKKEHQITQQTLKVITLLIRTAILLHNALEQNRCFFCVCWVKLWHIAQYQLPITSGIYFNHSVSNYNAICYQAFQRAQTLIEAKQGSFYCIWVLLKPWLRSSESRSWHYEGEGCNRRKELNSEFMTFNRAVWITGFSELSFNR